MTRHDILIGYAAYFNEFKVDGPHQKPVTRRCVIATGKGLLCDKLPKLWEKAKVSYIKGYAISEVSPDAFTLSKDQQLVYDGLVKKYQSSEARHLLPEDFLWCEDAKRYAARIERHYWELADYLRDMVYGIGGNTPLVVIVKSGPGRLDLRAGIASAKDIWRSDLRRDSFPYLSLSSLGYGEAYAGDIVRAKPVSESVVSIAEFLEKMGDIQKELQQLLSFVGQAMKLSKGAGNPGRFQQIIKELIK